ncbi:MAG: hypothetical protein QXX12_06660 [Nanopusillaceae archaeon]
MELRAWGRGVGVLEIRKFEKIRKNWKKCNRLFVYLWILGDGF